MDSRAVTRIGAALLILLCAAAGTTAGDLPSDTSLRPVKAADVPTFCEGVVRGADGTLYISDVIGGVIYTLAPGGALKPWAKTGEPNGHKILADGTHLVCDGSCHAVLHFAADGTLLDTAASAADGHRLKTPNDLTLDQHGGFYFTDPGDSWTQNPTGEVYYVDSTGAVHTAAQGLAYPNGIVLRPGGRVLLVGESANNRILTFNVTAPGTLKDKKVFAGLPAAKDILVLPDGICLDTRGNLYVAHFGMGSIEVLNPQGKLIRHYAAGNLTASNVAFAGPAMDQLYITGALHERSSKGAVFRLDLKGTQGLPTHGTR